MSDTKIKTVKQEIYKVIGSGTSGIDVNTFIQIYGTPCNDEFQNLKILRLGNTSLTSFSIEGLVENQLPEIQYNNSLIDTTGLKYKAVFKSIDGLKSTDIEIYLREDIIDIYTGTPGNKTWGLSETETVQFSFTYNGTTLSQQVNQKLIKKLNSLTIEEKTVPEQFTNTPINKEGFTVNAFYDGFFSPTVYDSLSIDFNWEDGTAASDWPNTTEEQTVIITLKEDKSQSVDWKIKPTITKIENISTDFAFTQMQQEGKHINVVDSDNFTFLVCYNNRNTKEISYKDTDAELLFWEKAESGRVFSWKSIVVSYTEQAIDGNEYTVSCPVYGNLYRKFISLEATDFSTNQFTENDINTSGVVFTAKYFNGDSIIISQGVNIVPDPDHYNKEIKKWTIAGDTFAVCSYIDVNTGIPQTVRKDIIVSALALTKLTILPVVDFNIGQYTGETPVLNVRFSIEYNDPSKNEQGAWGDTTKGNLSYKTENSQNPDNWATEEQEQICTFEYSWKGQTVDTVLKAFPKKHLLKLDCIVSKELHQYTSHPVDFSDFSFKAEYSDGTLEDLEPSKLNQIKPNTGDDKTWAIERGEQEYLFEYSRNGFTESTSGTIFIKKKVDKIIPLENTLPTQFLKHTPSFDGFKINIYYQMEDTPEEVAYSNLPYGKMIYEIQNESGEWVESGTWGESLQQQIRFTYTLDDSVKVSNPITVDIQKVIDRVELKGLLNEQERSTVPNLSTLLFYAYYSGEPEPRIYTYTELKKLLPKGVSYHTPREDNDQIWDTTLGEQDIKIEITTQSGEDRSVFTKATIIRVPLSLAVSQRDDVQQNAGQDVNKLGFTYSVVYRDPTKEDLIGETVSIISNIDTQIGIPEEQRRIPEIQVAPYPCTFIYMERGYSVQDIIDIQLNPIYKLISTNKSNPSYFSTFTIGESADDTFAENFYYTYSEEPRTFYVKCIPVSTLKLDPIAPFAYNSTFLSYEGIENGLYVFKIKPKTFEAQLTISATFDGKLYDIYDNMYEVDTNGTLYNFTRAESAIAAILPDGFGLIKVGDEVFKGNNFLTSITLNNDLQEIGRSSFESCTELTSITIPVYVSLIGVSAFSGCTKLKQATFKETNSFTISSKAFQNCSVLSTVDFLACKDNFKNCIIGDGKNLDVWQGCNLKVVKITVGNFSKYVRMIYLDNSIGSNQTWMTGRSAGGIQVQFEVVSKVTTRRTWYKILPTSNSTPAYEINQSGLAKYDAAYWTFTKSKGSYGLFSMYSYQSCNPGAQFSNSSRGSYTGTLTATNADLRMTCGVSARSDSSCNLYMVCMGLGSFSDTNYNNFIANETRCGYKFTTNGRVGSEYVQTSPNKLGTDFGNWNMQANVNDCVYPNIHPAGDGSSVIYKASITDTDVSNFLYQADNTKGEGRGAYSKYISGSYLDFMIPVYNRNNFTSNKAL